MSKIKISLVTLFFVLSGLTAFSILYFFTSVPKASAVNFDEMKEAGLEDIGETAYGSDAPQNSVPEIIAEIIKYLLSFLGLLFLILTLYGGFLWMTAAGNDDQIAKAKAIIVNGIVGLIIILAAYSITYFVLEHVLKVTQG